jgi:hypothetical protein
MGVESVFELKRPGYGPNIAILENCATALASSSDCDINHGLAQVISANYLARE